MTASKVRCHFCSKERHPGEIAHSGEGRQTMCLYCADWSAHALEVLSGAIPHGCQECGRDWDALKERAVHAEVKMYVVPKDGIYQLLCRSCCDAYVPKRRDLYGGTAHGRTINL